jgi:hypothetical protein
MSFAKKFPKVAAPDPTRVRRTPNAPSPGYKPPNAEAKKLRKRAYARRKGGLGGKFK